MLMCKWWHHWHAGFVPHTQTRPRLAQHKGIHTSKARGSDQTQQLQVHSSLRGSAPFICGSFHVCARRSHIHYNTWILMWINELESNEIVVQINEMLEPECKAILDHVPSVMKIIWFWGLSWMKWVKKKKSVDLQSCQLFLNGLLFQPQLFIVGTSNQFASHHRAPFYRGWWEICSKLENVALNSEQCWKVKVKLKACHSLQEYISPTTFVLICWR